MTHTRQEIVQFFEKYIQTVFLDLVTKATIDHRNYDGRQTNSRLREMIKESGSFDTSIKKMAEMVFEEFNTRFNHHDTEDLINEINEFIGLNELLNIHQDDKDTYDEMILNFI